MSVFSGPEIVNNGLVLSLDAGNTKSYPGSGTTWTDLSGNGNHITWINTPSYDGTGFTFNGTTHYGSANSTASLTTTIPTIFMASTVGTGTAFAKGGYGSYWNYGMTSISATSFLIRNNNGDYSSPTYTATSGTNIYCGTHNGTHRNYYLNGSYLGQTSTGYSPSATNSLFLRIGCAWNQSSQVNVEFFNGKISFIMVYNRELTAAEISQNFNALRGRFGI